MADQFEQLKQKYQPVLDTIQREGAVLHNLNLDGNQLFLIPGPLSGQQLRRVRYPLDAEIIGRVTGVVMSLIDRQEP